MRMLCLFSLLLVAGCSNESADQEAAEDDELRTPTAVVELALDEATGKCEMRSATPRVKFNRVVRLKNVGEVPIAALVSLWSDVGGMPAPEGGDIEPGKFVSVKMSTRWWILEENPESKEWGTSIVCKKGPWSNDEDMDEVGEVQVYR